MKLEPETKYIKILQKIGARYRYTFFQLKKLRFLSFLNILFDFKFIVTKFDTFLPLLMEVI